MRKVIKKVIIFIFLPIILSLAIDTVYFNYFSPGLAESIDSKVLGASEINVNNISRTNLDKIASTTQIIATANKQENSNFNNFSEQLVFEINNTDYNLDANSGGVLDSQRDNWLFEKNINEVQPIASITKLLTALVFLNLNPGWEINYIIKNEDKREGGKIYLFSGDTVKVKDLFYFSLVGSDNTATIALVKSTGLNEEQFVSKMNEKAKNLGCSHTSFKDPVGLSSNNVSTVREIAKIAKIALSNADISRASLIKRYEFLTAQGRKKSINNTNELLNNFSENKITILGGKTGYIEASGYCLAAKFGKDTGQEIITVILGAKNDLARFELTKELVNLVFNGTSN